MAGFHATFLGHQGWLLGSKATTWLVDPLLCEDFGAAHALSYRVYPPRELDAAALPAIDAVFLTHEHDDHFDIPSLALLDRTIPIFLSARSSTAARRILEVMGFAVVPLEPGVVVAQGDLELVPFAGDHLAVNPGDEWDALPFSVRHTGGDGAFFSMVDVTRTPRHLAWARAHAKTPGLVTWSNNTIDLGHMLGAPARVEDAERSAEAMLREHALAIEAWGRPAATLVCAGGFAFTGDRAWMNERVFTVDAEALCERAARAFPGDRFRAPTPGETFFLEGGALARAEPSAPFLRAAPRATWPRRGCARQGPVPDYAPATGRRSLSAADRAALEDALGELAAAMVGGTTFMGLYSLLSGEAPGRRAAMALALRAEPGERLVYEHDAPSCAFRRVDATSPERTHVAGLACWASDLLAVLRGELGPIAIQFGRATEWNALPRRLRFEIFEDLYRVSHPLRRPAAFLRAYEAQWASAAATRPVVRAHRLDDG